MHTKRQGRRFNRPDRSIGWLAGIFLLGFALSSLGRGQAVSVLDSFDGISGAIPTALIQGKDGNFYGTTATGAGTGGGCVYEVTPEGVVTILHKFGDGTVTNDGAMPTAGLIQASNGNFYGTTSSGGSASKGTVFAVKQGVVSILHSFGDGRVANDGAVPHGSLVQGSDGNLYGTTSQGGSAGEGAIFELTLQGAVTILHSFGNGTIASDGASPEVGLVSDGQGDFYGATSSGGTENVGTVFKLNAQKQVSILYRFTQPGSYSFSSGSGASIASGPGGFYPNSRLTLGSDGNLYGTTASSGYGYGAIYQVTPQGQETVLHYFGDGSMAYDGRCSMPVVENAESVLTEDANGNFYGTTTFGGATGLGTLFELTSAGQLNILHSFGSSASDGILPLSGVIMGSDGSLYGTTGAGGSSVDLDGGSLGYSGTLNLNAGSTQIVDSSNPFISGGIPGSITIASGVITISGSGTTAVPAHFGTIFKVVADLPAVTSPLQITGSVGVNFSYQTVATQTPTAYSATGLPTGLTINSTTGLISGTPMSDGTSTVTVTVTNAVGSTSVTLYIAVFSPPVITSVLSEFGSTGATFGYQIAATGTSVIYSATGLPAGLVVDPASGIISGTPTVTGTFPVSLTATNAAGTDTETLTLVLTAIAPTLAQEYTLVHSFGDGSVSGEGAFPGGLIAGPTSTFYGVTTQGGSTGSGTVFNLSAKGDGNVLNALSIANGSSPQGLVQAADGTFYGVTQNGGSTGQGTIFHVTADGTVTLLHTFGDGTVSNDGASPQAGLIQGDDGNFYGTTQYGGSANLGTIFKMTTLGAVTIVHSFGDGSVTKDGAQPVAALVEESGVYYGTALSGGSAGDGAVFALYPNGKVSILHSFADGSVANDGQLPHAALILDPVTLGNLYGTTVDGGTLGRGTIFKITTPGAVTILHNFGDGSVANDGTYPIAPLVIFNSPQNGLTFFGTTPTGGTSGDGTVFSMSSSHIVTILHNFGDGTVTNDGQTPMSGLCLDTSGNLYGTTIGGGTGSGTMYVIVANLTPPSAPPVPTGDWSFTGTLPTGLAFDETTGAILGTPSESDAVGNYTVTITSPQSVAKTQTYTLTQTYVQWATAKSTPDLAQAAPSADGVPPLLKYLYDINPTTYMTADDRAALPVLGLDTTSVLGAAYITLTYRQYAALAGTTVTLETSDDLQTWSPVPASQLLCKQVGIDTTTVSQDPIMEMGVKVDGSVHQFVRLQVSSQ